MPVWAKLTPSTTDIVDEASGAFLGGADADLVVEHLSVAAAHRPRDARVRDERRRATCRAAGWAARPSCRSRMAKMAQLTQAFPDKAFSGIGGIAEFAHALNYFLLGCGTVQVCTAAMLDHAIGPNVIAGLIARPDRVPRPSRRARLDVGRGLPRPAPRPRRHALARSAGPTRRHISAGTTPKATPRDAGSSPRTDEPVRRRDLSTSPLWNPDLAPTRPRPAHVVHLSTSPRSGSA